MRETLLSDKVTAPLSSNSKYRHELKEYKPRKETKARLRPSVAQFSVNSKGANELESEVQVLNHRSSKYFRLSGPKDSLDFRNQTKNNSSRNRLGYQADAAGEITFVCWDLGFDWAGSLQGRDLLKVPIFTVGSFRGLD